MTSTQLPVERAQVIPEWREGRGSLGSATVELSGGCPEVFASVVERLGVQFRKAWYDLASQIAVFMAPSAMHESTARGTLELVQALCECFGLAVVPMGATSAHAARAGGGSARADPDESFFVGPRAERFLVLMHSRGREAAIAEMQGEPRDLVVEVEHAHRSTNKRGIYRDAGVTELWELATGAAGRAPAIWDLQTRAAPTETPASRVLAGVMADALPAAMVELDRIGGLVGLGRALGRGEPAARSLLASAGVAAPKGRREEPVP